MRTLLIAMALVLTGCDIAVGSDELPVGTAPITKELALPPAFNQVVIIGDSIMSVSFDSERGPNYTGTVAHRLAAMEYKVANMSRGGGTIKEFYQSKGWGAVNYVLRGPTAIVIELGWNDSSGRSTIEEFEQMYIGIISNIEVKSPDQETFCFVPIVAAYRYDTLTAEGSSRADYREVVRKIAAAGHCTLIDTEGWLSESLVNDGYHLPDGLHPGDYAQELMANGIVEALTAGRGMR